MKLSLNVGLTWPEVEHLFSVGYKGWTVGKVWSAMDPQTDAMSWQWHLCIPMSLPDDSQGVARSKSEALQALAESLQGLILRTSPDRLQRAFLLAEASGLTFEAGATMEFDVGELAPSEAAEPLALVLAPARPLAIATMRPVAPPTGAQMGQPAALAERKRPVIKVKMTTRSRGAVVTIPKAPATMEDLDQGNPPLETDQG